MGDVAVAGAIPQTTRKAHPSRGSAGYRLKPLIQYSFVHFCRAAQKESPRV